MRRFAGGFGIILELCMPDSFCSRLRQNVINLPMKSDNSQKAVRHIFWLFPVEKNKYLDARAV